MNSRERFVATMHYQPRDRCPIMDFGFWDETLPLWEEQGYPKGANPDVYFGMDPQYICTPVDVGMHPGFETKILEDRGTTEIIRDGVGVIMERGKYMGSIPRHIEHTLKDRASWEKDFKHRLNGDDPTRFPADWDEYVKRYNDPARDYPLGINGGSLYGWLRDWMGVENLSMLVYDDRKLFEEMVETVTNCILVCLQKQLETGIDFQYCSMWEDMCYKSGPLLSPKIFKDVLVPHYRRITSLLNKYGVDITYLDCDGDMTKLMPMWLECGVNTMFPIEVGTWNADPVAFRKQYGKDLRMIGGVSKRLLASTTEAITAEVERLAPLVEEGGYIPTPDHRVPPDVSFSNYCHYLKEAKRVWGKGLL